MHGTAEGAPRARDRRRVRGRVPIFDLTRCGAIGLDFGTERVNLVQFSRGTEPRVRAALSLPYRSDRHSTLHDSGELEALLRPALRAGGFSGRHFVAALPPGLVDLRFLPYRRLPGRSEGEAIVATLQEQMAERLADSVVDYLPIRPKSEEQAERAALVAIAEQAAVVALLERLATVGCVIDALEVGPVAIKRLLGVVNRRHGDNKVLCINFGEKTSYVTVLWEGELLLDRQVDFGQQTLLTVLCEALEVDADEAYGLLTHYGIEPAAVAGEAGGDDIGTALFEILTPAFRQLAAQIKKMLVYTAAETRGGAIDRIYLLGSVPRWRGVDAALRELVELPVETINPFYGFPLSPTARRRGELVPLPGIAVSAGLALRGLTDDA